MDDNKTVSTEEVDINIWEYQIKGYVTHFTIMCSGLKRNCTLVWGQFSESMRGNLDFLPVLPPVRDTYAVVKLLNILQGVTSQFKGNMQLHHHPHELKSDSTRSLKKRNRLLRSKSRSSYHWHYQWKSLGGGIGNGSTAIYEELIKTNTALTIYGEYGAARSSALEVKFAIATTKEKYQTV